MDPQELKVRETDVDGSEDIPPRDPGQNEEEQLKQLIEKGKIGESQKNVATKDLKEGRKMEALPYLYVGRPLPLDLAQETSKDWYDENDLDVFNTAVFLLRCQNITVKKMQTVRAYFDGLPTERELARLIADMDDNAFTAYLAEYQKSRDPVVLSHRIREMEVCVTKIQESVNRSEAVIGKMEKMLESATPSQNDDRNMKSGGHNKNAKKKEEEADEESFHREFEAQKAGLERIEKLYKSGEINEAQKTLGCYHVRAGLPVDSLPYLQSNSFLTISMIDDLDACMKAGMDADTISAILRQESMTAARWKIISELYPNLPGKEELIQYIAASDSDEEFQKKLTEYKNRNDIEWVRAQLRDKENQLQRMDSRNKAMEEELQRLKEAPKETTDEADGKTDREDSWENTPDERTDGKTSEGDEESSTPAEAEKHDETEDENRVYDDSGDAESSDDISQNSREEEKTSFLERLFPGFYHADSREVIQTRQKEKLRKKKTKELRAEMKRTLEDLYAQDVIDEESFYIFAELAFKEQRMNEKAATFLVTEMRNGVPFSLLCKVIKYMKDSGEWSSAARVLAELIRYQEAVEMQAQPV